MSETSASATPYELFYWPGLQGRGELVRLAFEDAGQPYEDVCRDPAKGAPALLALLAKNPHDALRPLAPPILRHGSVLLAQTANILFYLAPKLDLAPEGEVARLAALQLQLTLTDFIAEAHDTHHPIGTSLYYEDQKPEALRRTRAFLDHRLPKFLRYFESVIAENASPSAPLTLLGRHTYVDLSLFQVVSGLRHAFPKAMQAFEPEILSVAGLVARVEARPNIAAYLASPRRLPWNLHGIFRAYPELDLEPHFDAGRAP